MFITEKQHNFLKCGFMSFLAIVLSPPFFNSVCVQAFIIWITVVEVMVYPFVLEPVLRQASVCPPTGMFDARLFTFQQIIILTTMKLRNKLLIEIKTILPDKKGYDLSE